MRTYLKAFSASSVLWEVGDLAKETGKQANEIDPNTDRYPSLTTVIDIALQDEDFPQGDVERFEVTLLASGEATYRVWAVRAEEPVGGYIRAV
jgi:hypothetical protein